MSNMHSYLPDHRYDWVAVERAIKGHPPVGRTLTEREKADILARQNTDPRITSDVLKRHGILHTPKRRGKHRADRPDEPQHART